MRKQIRSFYDELQLEQRKTKVVVQGLFGEAIVSKVNHTSRVQSLPLHYLLQYFLIFN